MQYYKKISEFRTNKVNTKEINKLYTIALSHKKQNLYITQYLSNTYMIYKSYQRFEQTIEIIHTSRLTQNQHCKAFQILYCPIRIYSIPIIQPSSLVSIVSILFLIPGIHKISLPRTTTGCVFF